MVQIFKEDILQFTTDADTTNCPSRSVTLDDNGMVQDISYDQIPECSSDFFLNDSAGCCKTPLTCAASSVGGQDTNSTGLSFLYNDMPYNICHDSPIQDLMTGNLLNDPNIMVKFLKLLFVGLLSILVTAIIGCCYEFWLRYGNSIDCIYYKSKISNIGVTNKINLIDYIFPASQCYYPYQEAEIEIKGGSTKNPVKGQKGGEQYGINSTYKENYTNHGAKCVTVYNDETMGGGKVFPYNIADFDSGNGMINMTLKAFSFFFLYTVLISRFCFNQFFTFISRKYNEIIKNGPIKSNIVFLLLTGLIFNMIGVVTQNATLQLGPTFWLGLLLSFNSTFLNPGLTFIIALACTIMPDLRKKSLEKCGIDSDYYRVFSLEPFFQVRDTPKSVLDMNTKIKHVVFNILLLFPYFLFSIFSLVTGMIGTVLGHLYFTLSLIFNLFYIPLNNSTEFLDLLKSHGDLLTILFCISIVGSAHFSGFSPTTTGVMGGILAMIILYKLITSKK